MKSDFAQCPMCGFFFVCSCENDDGSHDECAAKRDPWEPPLPLTEKEWYEYNHRTDDDECIDF